MLTPSGKVIPAQHVRMATPCAMQTQPPAVSKPQPVVKLIKDGETVKVIEIHCSCGEVIRLDCEY
jgi:hypothetical protein